MIIASIPLLVFGVCLILYIIAVSDFSYFFLVLSCIITFIWWLKIKAISWPLKQSRWFPQALFATISPFIITLGVLTTLHFCTVNLVQIFGSHQYEDRVNVWIDGSGYYPYAGWQVNKALSWTHAELAPEKSGTDRARSPEKRQQSAKDIFSIPAVDDDFALTGWKASYKGKMPKLMPLFALCCLVFGLLCYATQFQQQVSGRHDFIGEDKGFIFELFIVGVVGFLIGNAFLSFSTNFQILPVMGQPFPFLGRQGSFLFLFMFPALWLITIYQTVTKPEVEN
jgi:cell division protein FtsW (lipid II flippase)